MKKLIALVTLLLGAALFPPQAPQARPAHAPKYEYTLKSVMPVAGRQGVACDGKYIYVSDSKKLFKYDMNGKLLKQNDNPFEATPSRPITSGTSTSTTANCTSAPRISWTAWARIFRSPCTMRTL